MKLPELQNSDVLTNSADGSQMADVMPDNLSKVEFEEPAISDAQDLSRTTKFFFASGTGTGEDGGNL